MAGRHFRTSLGALFMALGALTVLAGRWLEPTHTGCATTWVEVIHKFAFPALLFLGGMALFNRTAFGDLVEGGKGFASRVIRRRGTDA